jgi:hypothetical protein
MSPRPLVITYLAKGRSYYLSVLFPLVKFCHHDIASEELEKLHIALQAFGNLWRELNIIFRTISQNWVREVNTIPTDLDRVGSATKMPPLGLGHNPI